MKALRAALDKVHPLFDKEKGGPLQIAYPMYEVARHVFVYTRAKSRTAKRTFVTTSISSG